MPTSRFQSLAINPVADRIIMTMNAATMTSDTIPTRSDLSRRQASTHRPGDTVCGISRWNSGARSRSAAMSVAMVYLSCTRGSTAL